jgi:hypothetical protein
MHPDAWPSLLRIWATADVLSQLSLAVMDAVQCEDDVALAELASTGTVAPSTQAHGALGHIISATEAGLRVITAAAAAGVWVGPATVSSIALASGLCRQRLSGLHRLLQRSDKSSQEYGQFYSLLSTLQKLGRSALQEDGMSWRQQKAGCCYAAAEGAALLLHPGMWLHPYMSGSGSSASQPGSSSGSSSGSAQLSPPATAAAVAGQAVHVLPSLVIFGRVCLHWAKELHRQTPLLLQQQWQQCAVDSAAGVCIEPLEHAEPGAPTRFLWH